TSSSNNTSFAYREIGALDGGGTYDASGSSTTLNSTTVTNGVASSSAAQSNYYSYIEVNGESRTSINGGTYSAEDINAGVVHTVNSSLSTYDIVEEDTVAQGSSYDYSYTEGGQAEIISRSSSSFQVDGATG